MADRAEATVRRRTVHKLPGGRTVEICALGLGDFIAARERALQQYKRTKIETWTANADLLPDDQRTQWIREAFERAEALTVDDLPRRKMKLPARRADGAIIRDGRGEPVLRDAEVEYAAWWMSETAEGRLFMTYLSIRRGDPSFTLDAADELFINAMDELETTANLVGELSTPSLGNSSAPAEPSRTPGQRRAERRRRRKIGR